jgi:hypothetical protein
MIGIANFARASKPIALAVLLQLGETYLCDAAPTDLSASQTIALASTHSSPLPKSRGAQDITAAYMH